MRGMHKLMVWIAGPTVVGFLGHLVGGFTGGIIGSIAGVFVGWWVWYRWFR